MKVTIIGTDVKIEADLSKLAERVRQALQKGRRKLLIITPKNESVEEITLQILMGLNNFWDTYENNKGDEEITLIIDNPEVEEELKKKNRMEKS